MDRSPLTQFTGSWAFRHTHKALLSEFRHNLTLADYDAIANRVNGAVDGPLVNGHDVASAFDIFASLSTAREVPLQNNPEPPGSSYLPIFSPQTNSLLEGPWTDMLPTVGATSTEESEAPLQEEVPAPTSYATTQSMTTHIFSDQAAESDEGPSNPNSDNQFQSKAKYPCEQCHMFFATRKHWNEHRNRSCFPVGRFECRLCDYSASRRDNARSHLSKTHRQHFPTKNDLCAELKKRTRDLTHEFHERCGYCTADGDFDASSQEPFLNRLASDEHIFQHLEHHINTHGSPPVWKDRCTPKHLPKPAKRKASD